MLSTITVPPVCYVHSPSVVPMSSYSQVCNRETDLCHDYWCLVNNSSVWSVFWWQALDNISRLTEFFWWRWLAQMTCFTEWTWTRVHYVSMGLNIWPFIFVYLYEHACNSVNQAAPTEDQWACLCSFLSESIADDINAAHLLLTTTAAATVSSSTAEETVAMMNSFLAQYPVKQKQCVRALWIKHFDITCCEVPLKFPVSFNVFDVL